MGIFSNIVGDLPGKSAEVFSYENSWRAAQANVLVREETLARAPESAPSWQGKSYEAFSYGIRTEVLDLRTLIDGIGEGRSSLEKYGWALASYEFPVEELKRANKDLDRDFESLSFPDKVKKFFDFMKKADHLAQDYKSYVDKAHEAAQICAAELYEALHIEKGVPGKPNSDGKRAPISQEDIERIRKQLESGELSYKDTAQRGIGDCYYLATIMALTQSKEGRELLRDSIQVHYGADGKPDGFMVTVYDDPMNPNAKARRKVFVDDVYAKGVVGPDERPNYVSILESAYGQAHPGGTLSSGEHGITGGYITEAAQDLTNNSAVEIRRHGGFFGFGEGYDSLNRELISKIVNSGHPVTAETATAPGSNFKENRNIVEVTLENGENARITVHHAHAYTVLKAGKDGVTLANPWGKNFTDTGTRVSGSFTMSWDDFGKYYGSVAVGKVR